MSGHLGEGVPRSKLLYFYSDPIYSGVRDLVNALTVDVASGIRLGLFLLVFVGLALSERRWPKRQLRVRRFQRWFANIGLGVLNSMAIRFLVPFAGVASAL